jgi:hypothetical protein
MYSSGLTGLGARRFRGLTFWQEQLLISCLNSPAISIRRARSMDWPDYLRDQAAMYRQLAEQADDAVVKNEMFELASVCEDVANNIEDNLTGG